MDVSSLLKKCDAFPKQVSAPAAPQGTAIAHVFGASSLPLPLSRVPSVGCRMQQGSSHSAAPLASPLPPDRAAAAAAAPLLRCCSGRRPPSSSIAPRRAAPSRWWPRSSCPCSSSRSCVSGLGAVAALLCAAAAAACWRMSMMSRDVPHAGQAPAPSTQLGSARSSASWWWVQGCSRGSTRSMS